MDLGHVWWIWLALGLVLLIGEVMAAGGFVLLFFGAAALVVGGLAGAEILVGLWVQIVVFGVLSVISLLVFRESLLARLGGKRGIGVLEGVSGTAILVDPLAPGGSGRAEFQGSPWTAKNVGPVLLAGGQKVDVVRAEGLTLEVKAPRSS